MPQPWDLAGAFEAGAAGAQKIRQNDINAQAEAAAGNALVSMFNAPMPGAQPMPGAGAPPGGMPGGQSPMGGQPPPAAPQGGMSPQAGLLQQIYQRLRSAPQVQPGGGGPMGPPPAAPMPGAQPMPAAVAPQGAPGAMPQAGPPQGGMPPGGQGQPQLDWRMVVQQVVKANPGIKDPRVIAAAVDRFLPIMNQQSQMQWRQIGLQLRAEQVGQGEQRLQQGQERIETQREQGQQRLEQGQQRLDISKQREERLSSSAQIRQDQAWQRLELSKQQLQRQITQGGQRNLVGQWRAVVDAQHKRAQEIIQSVQAGVPADERKKLIDEENKFYEQQIKNMRKMMEGGGRASFSERFGAAPEAQAEPAGTQTYVPGQGWQ